MCFGSVRHHNNEARGDGATPVGRFQLLYGYYRPQRVNKPGGPMQFEPADKTMGWCDEPEHQNYNQPVSLPFSASHETLTREDRLYDICIVMDYNIFPKKRGAGSAIFFHLTSPELKPTEGCVALDPEDMQRLLPMLSTDVEMVISAG